MTQNPDIHFGIIYLHLKFLGKENTKNVGLGTVEKFTPRNMNTAVGILSLRGTEPEIHMGEGRGNLLPPQLQRMYVKTPFQTCGLLVSVIYFKLNRSAFIFFREFFHRRAALPPLHRRNNRIETGKDPQQCIGPPTSWS